MYLYQFPTNPLAITDLLALLWPPILQAPLSPPEWYDTTTALITQGPHFLLAAPDLSPGARVIVCVLLWPGLNGSFRGFATAANSSEHTAPHSGIYSRHKWVIAKHHDATHTLLRAYDSNLCLTVDSYSHEWAPVTGDAVVLAPCPTAPDHAFWRWERSADGHSFALEGSGAGEPRFWLDPPAGEGGVSVTDRWNPDVQWGVEKLDLID